MYFSTNEVSYWYEINGNGPALVLLHGFTGSTQTWINYVQKWQDRYQIVTVDLPGHGKTKNNSPRTMEECCEDLMQLFTHLQLTDVNLVGYSMGGRTALSFAFKYPDMVKSLILESASPGLESPIERNQRVAHDERLASRLEQEGLAAFVDFWENIPLFETQKKLPLQVRQAVRKERMSQSTEGLAQSLRYMGTGKQPSWWNRLDRFAKPVLLVCGAKDEKFVTINKRMQNLLQSAKLVICEHTGHAIHVEQPEFFGKIVSEFIDLID